MTKQGICGFYGFIHKIKNVHNWPEKARFEQQYFTGLMGINERKKNGR